MNTQPLSDEELKAIRKRASMIALTTITLEYQVDIRALLAEVDRLKAEEARLRAMVRGKIFALVEELGPVPSVMTASVEPTRDP